MMCKGHDHRRRGVLKMLGAGGIAGLAGGAYAAGQGSVGALIPGKGWVPAGGDACVGDGTPQQWGRRRRPGPNKAVPSAVSTKHWVRRTWIWPRTP